MATAMAIIGLVTVAAIHWAQVVPAIRDAPYLGTAFLLLTLACIGLAFGLLISDSAVAWISVAVVSGMTIAGYIFTRTVSSFFDDQDVGNWSEPLGMVALLVETLLISLTIYWLLRARHSLGADRHIRVSPSIDLRTDTDGHDDTTAHLHPS
jgi:hypothetical protein